MGEVEEDLKQNHLVPVVVSEEKCIMLATGGMGRNEKVMKALGSVEYTLFVC